MLFIRYMHATNIYRPLIINNVSFRHYTHYIVDMSYNPTTCTCLSNNKSKHVRCFINWKFVVSPKQHNFRLKFKKADAVDLEYVLTQIFVCTQTASGEEVRSLLNRSTASAILNFKLSLTFTFFDDACICMYNTSLCILYFAMSHTELANTHVCIVVCMLFWLRISTHFSYFSWWQILYFWTTLFQQETYHLCSRKLFVQWMTTTVVLRIVKAARMQAL